MAPSERFQKRPIAAAAEVAGMGHFLYRFGALSGQKRRKTAKKGPKSGFCCY
jgi:hypothetical protein